MPTMSDEHAPPEATVVLPTRDRPHELRRCLAAILESAARTSYEIIVVDDGSEPALVPENIICEGGPDITLLRRDGMGPARARNAGIHEARGSVVLFTDDDTIPQRGWVDAACDFLSTHPVHVGVEGPTTSPPFDPLYFHSVRATVPGSFLTCNIAYRRHALLHVGGFADAFPFPHAEDLDLGLRITKLGELGYTETMTVVHPPRPVSLRNEMRRGRVMASDATLFARHPEMYPKVRYVSGAGYAFVLNAKRWLYCAVRDVYAVGGNPWRGLRFLALASGYTLWGSVALLVRRFVN